MKIGVPKEIKNHEYRVGLTPSTVRELVAHGHEVLVETHAAAEIGLDDEAYMDAGAEIAETAKEVYAEADMVVKVKEPQPHECRMLRSGQILFAYLHLAPDLRQTELLLASGAACIAYETVTDAYGSLPLLAPMSEVAGRLSIQVGAHHLERECGGRGVLLGGVPGVEPGKVVIIGGGVVGSNAAKMAVGLGADVAILDRSLHRLRELDDIFGNSVKTVFASKVALEEYTVAADLVVGAVLIPGASAPKLLSRGQIKRMKKGSVVVDVAIDQGGCFETSRPTTHQEPTYVVDGVVHYCVANMPGAVARTATLALNNATHSHVVNLADHGVRQALLSDPHLLNGLNICQGKITNQAVAEALGYDFMNPKDALEILDF